MTNPNDPAFPNKDHMGDGPNGLTKREWFSAMALNHEVQYVLDAVDSDLAKETFQTIAANCVRMADALIKELSK